MDITLRERRGTPREFRRNRQAWDRWSTEDGSCRYCPHGYFGHLISANRPHVYLETDPENQFRKKNLDRHRQKNKRHGYRRKGQSRRSGTC